MAFREWAANERLINVGSLEQLRETRIAIDAEDYLHTLLTTHLTREPLLPALGGLPFALKKHVDNDLAQFADAGVTPVFVFNGLEVAARDRSAIAKEANKAAATLNEAWSIYDQGRGSDAVAAFGKACTVMPLIFYLWDVCADRDLHLGTYRTAHIVTWLHAHLHKAGCFVVTAPYHAAAQIVEYEATGYVDAIAGSASCLVFGGERVITKFEWEDKRASWIELTQCQNKLAMSKEQFIDLMLLSGCSMLPTFPDFDDLMPTVEKIASTRALLTRSGNDGHAVCLQHKDEGYLTAFRKAKFAIRHAVVITPEGKMEQKDPGKVPNDTHEFTGARLPDEMYSYLSRGVVGPRVLNWRTRMEIFETPPLDSGASAAYRDLIQDKLAPLRAQVLVVITRQLHRYFHKKDIELTCWFNETERRQLGIPDMMPAEATDVERTWHVKEDAIQGGETDVLNTPLSVGINMLAEDDKARQTVTERSEGPATLSKSKELLMNTVFRLLHDRGYVNPNHTLSAWGKALKASLDRAKSNGYIDMALTSAEAEEALFMAFELLRLNILNNKSMFDSPAFSGPPMRGTDIDKATTLLISRIASLGLLRHKEIGYTGPLSRHLLAYHQMAAAVRNTLRDLAEAHACNMLLSGAVPRDLPPKQLTDLGANLPFLREPDLGLALVVKSYLDELSNEKRADCTQWFSHAEDIHGDLDKAWKMWDAVNAGIQAADSSIVSNDTRKTFKNADEWLASKRASVPTTNGAA